MRNKKNAETKRCPFYDEICLESECRLYSEKLKNCLFDVVCHNLYTLRETIKGIHLIKE